MYLIKFLTIINKIRTTVDMLSRHSDRCLLWWKCPEFYLTVLGIFIRYVNAHLMSLILGGHAHESIWLQTVLSFFTSHLCVYWCQFQLPTWRLAVTSLACQPITHLLLFTSEDTIKEVTVIDEPACFIQVAITSITTPNQTILNVCTRYNILKALF